MDAVRRLRGLTYGGVSAAIIVILLYLTSVLRFNKLSILFLSSTIIGFIIVKFGIKYGVVTYGASSILAALLVIDKLIAVAFILGFGIYPILKVYIEKLKNLYFEWVIKLVIFNTDLFIVSRIFPDISANLSEKINLGIYVLIILVNFIFILYDILLSFAIQIASERFRI